MIPSIHVGITRDALQGRFAVDALDAILAANIGQDGFRGQFAHSEYHFDNDAFAAGYAYIDAQRALVLLALQTADPHAAQAAFGRLTHAAQDFYAHTNYVALWLSRRDGNSSLAASQIDPLDADLLASPRLHSGKLYYPQEILYFVRPLRKFALAFLPPDSHAHMNLDSADRGPQFRFAYQAAVKRTSFEFEKLRAALPSDLLDAFVGLEA
jgi:hypothetical protein